MVTNQVKMTDNYIPQLEALTPGGGAYLNEVCLLVRNKMTSS